MSLEERLQARVLKRDNSIGGVGLVEFLRPDGTVKYVRPASSFEIKLWDALEDQYLIAEQVPYLRIDLESAQSQLSALRGNLQTMRAELEALRETPE